MIFYIILGARFLTKVLSLIILSIWGYSYGKNIIIRILLSIGIPLLFAYVWSLFVAPKLSYLLTGVNKLTLEILLYTLASAALYSLGYRLLGITFWIMTIIICIAIFTFSIK